MRNRRARLLQKAASFVSQSINALCAVKTPMQFADGKWRLSNTFLDFFMMDGAEQASNTQVSVRSSIACDCPDSELGQTGR